jgi:hypothetical protein
MSLGRLIPVVSAVVLTGGVALAQPKDPAAPPAPADGAGATVAPIEDAPPADMEGTNEDPDAPRGDETPITAVGPAPMKKAGYPIEEAQRPITLPQNMSEISLAPRFMASPYVGGDTLRARYGITRQVQLGLNYVFAGVYDDPSTVSSKKGFHVGKTGGLDVTVLLTNWMGVRVGLPVYFDPFAMSFAAGAPMKFIFEKFAIGGLDDVLNIRITKFAPRYDYEAFNHAAAFALESNTEQSRGYLRISGYGVYQHQPNLAIIGRVGIDSSLGAGGDSATGAASGSDAITFIKAGVQLTPKKFLDVGVMAGFEDLSRAGSFGLSGILALRI